MPRPLRPWQARELRRFSSSSDTNFLLEATPGAGKTVFALTVARRMLNEGMIRRVIVVCPTSHLRRQWADAGLEFDIHLNPKFANGDGALSPDYTGIAVTYASLVTGAQIVRRLCTVPSLVVLDEVHHCAEEGHSAWGRTIGDAFSDVAVRRLLLSGTPFREDGRRIPFVRYEGGRADPDAVYRYSDAIEDGVCRPVEFLAFDGEMQWREVTGKTVTSLLSAAEKAKDERRAFRSALMPDGAWMSDVLTAADSRLTSYREEDPEAGGLVIANDIDSAHAYARILHRICGQDPVVVVSRDNGEDEAGAPNPSQLIKNFSKNTSVRWLVAVRMVSEGVDIPRLAVGVYATSTWTEMFFRQAVGRFVRGDGLATVFIPSVSTLLELVARIADEADAALRGQAERGDVDEGGDDGGQLPFAEPLAAGGATEHSGIFGGQPATADELADARKYKNTRPHLRGTPDTVVALMMRDFKGWRQEGSPPSSGDAATPPHISVEQRLDALRKWINRVVSRRAQRTGEPHRDIHAGLNRLCGDRMPTASTATLEKRLSILREWGEDA